VPNSRVPNSRVPNSRVPNSRVPNSRVPNSRVPNSRSAYITQYQKDHYDRLTLKVTGGYKELLKSEAIKRGVSLTKLVVNALVEYLQNHPV